MPTTSPIDISPWENTPYEPPRGCAVLAARVLAAHGIPYPDVDRPQDARAWMRVALPRPLDLVVFTLAGRPGHVGVCIGAGRFFHVEEGSRARVERLSCSLWSSRIEGIYRYTQRDA